MDNTTEETVEKKRQVKFTFTGLVATVYVNGSDDKQMFDIAPLSDDIKLELIQYGFKQKLSDFRASDKLIGDEKVAAMGECYEMLESGKFRQSREPSKLLITEEHVEAWSKMSDADKLLIKDFAPSRYKKLTEMYVKRNIETS